MVNTYCSVFLATIYNVHIMDIVAMHLWFWCGKLSSHFYHVNITEHDLNSVCDTMYILCDFTDHFVYTCTNICIYI